MAEPKLETLADVVAELRVIDGRFVHTPNSVFSRMADVVEQAIPSQQDSDAVTGDTESDGGTEAASDRLPWQYPGLDTRDVQRAIGKQCLRELWRIYDLGGQSVGRSLEADLLEHGMNLLFEETEHSTGRFRSDSELLSVAREARRVYASQCYEEFHRQSSGGSKVDGDGSE